MLLLDTISNSSISILSDKDGFIMAYVRNGCGSLGVHWGKMSAPYNFLNFGAPTGWFGFDLSLMSGETLGIGVCYMIVVLLLIFLGIGKLFLLVKDLRKKKVYGTR